jgi:hypothetical protein
MAVCLLCMPWARERARDVLCQDAAINNGGGLSFRPFKIPSFFRSMISGYMSYSLVE